MNMLVDGCTGENKTNSGGNLSLRKLLLDNFITY